MTAVELRGPGARGKSPYAPMLWSRSENEAPHRQRVRVGRSHFTGRRSVDREVIPHSHAHAPTRDAPAEAGESHNGGVSRNWRLHTVRWQLEEGSFYCGRGVYNSMTERSTGKFRALKLFSADRVARGPVGYPFSACTPLRSCSCACREPKTDPRRRRGREQFTRSVR